MQLWNLLVLGMFAWPSVAAMKEEEIAGAVLASVNDYKRLRALKDKTEEAQEWSEANRGGGPMFYNAQIASIRSNRTSHWYAERNSCETCPIGLGCFDCEAYGLGGLPSDPMSLNSIFRMYTREHLDGVILSYLNVKPAVELITRPIELVFVVHGYVSSARASWVHEIKDKVLENTDCVVITVDWSLGAGYTVPYMQAIRNSQVIGRQIASVLYQLIDDTDGMIDANQTHYIGHSLGAQMAIYFWEYFKELTDGLIIAKITGAAFWLVENTELNRYTHLLALDAAKSFYEDFNIYVNTSMANFVEALHTSMGRDYGAFGISIPIGHVDFYINGGTTFQPGCQGVFASFFCGHSRAHKYYAEAIDVNSNCTMFSYSCAGGIPQYESGSCQRLPDNWSAISFNHTQDFPGRGVQFVDTNQQQNRGDAVSFTYKDVSAATKFLDAPRMLVFIVHGFSSGASEPWVLQLKENVLNDDDALVITVDWSNGSGLPYYAQAVVNTELVGREIALVLYKLMQISPDYVSPATVHYIGHSLGAQMAMFLSEYFRKLSGDLLISRITALDPAAPLLEAYNVCLNSSSANYVDGIHTSAGNNILLGQLGVTRQVGHLDLYVNGGSKQPGCQFWDLTCAHQRSHEYYNEAAQLNTNCAFQSYACAGGMDEYKKGKCQKVRGSWNAISLDKSYAMPGRGVEFVDTRSSSPYCE